MTSFWAARYGSTDGYLFGTAPAQVLVENPGVIVPGQSALCVADGEGRNGVYLAGQGMTVTSFDAEPLAVDRAKALAAERGVGLTAQVSDWDGFDWEAGQFDLVVAIFVQFADPTFRARQFADLRRLTAPGGVLLLHGYTPEQVGYGTGGPSDPAHLYDPAMLTGAFGDWHILRLAAYERDVQEGRGHSGRSALIDLIARRP